MTVGVLEGGGGGWALEHLSASLDLQKMCGGLKYNVGICSCEYQSGTCNGLKFISLPCML